MKAKYPERPKRTPFLTGLPPSVPPNKKQVMVIVTSEQARARVPNTAVTIIIEWPKFDVAKEMVPAVPAIAPGIYSNTHQGSG